MLNVALLDDYAGVAMDCADWVRLDGKATISVFCEHLHRGPGGRRCCSLSTCW